MKTMTRKKTSNWKTFKLGEVTDILIGGTPARKKAEYWDVKKETSNVWISIKDLTRNGRYIGDSAEYISDLGVKHSNVKLIPKDTVLMSFKLSIGKTAITVRRVYTNEAIAAFIVKDPAKLDYRFLFYALPLLNYDTDTAVKGQTLNKEKLLGSKISFPHIELQQKIAAVLSEVDSDIDKTDQIIKQTELLKKGLMQVLFTRGIGYTKFKKTKLGEIPSEWQVLRIGEVCQVSAGGTPSRKDKANYVGSIPWVKSTEVRYNIIYDTEEHISQRALENSAAKILPVGTILLAMYGQGVTRGKCAVLGCNACTNQAVAALQLLDNLHNLYVFYYLQFKYDEIRELGHGGNQLNLNSHLIKNIALPVPSLDEQIKIASILSSVDGKINVNKEIKQQLIQLKKGLMQDLFGN